MYCANCGVELGEGEKSCPLCGLVAYHPDMPKQSGEGLYPDGFAPIKVKRGYVKLFFSFLFGIAAGTCLLIDYLISHRIGWSGIVLMSLLTGYVLLVLPLWFKKENWIVFLSLDTLAAELLLLYLNLHLGGHWFLSYAFPITAMYGIFLVTVTALAIYVRRGVFYLMAGSSFALAGSMMLVEFFGAITFERRMFVWSLYPTAALGALGLFWLLAGIIKPLGNMLQKRMFV